MGLIKEIKKAAKSKFKVSKAKYRAKNKSTAELKAILNKPLKARKQGFSSESLKGIEDELSRRKFMKKRKSQRNNVKLKAKRNKRSDFSSFDSGFGSMADNIDNLDFTGLNKRRK